MVSVINDAGECRVFMKSTPIVTEALLDGSTETYEEMPRTTDRDGQHVNNLGGGIYETMDGVRWKLHAAS